ncbi:hypothetical protein SBOR_6172 [Sclerotinia borealis F-4128]|uniref:Uncharacterized protein n=1 Tax=Sclerotinia borealis (strain F-4128) TaxID=1432307 RepID=W9CFZ6_SCLBF|nr:hypothetical protein SBOR_6172 [Sclerotinia borealis F-4128]
MNSRNDTLHNSIYLISSPALYLLSVAGLCVPFAWPVYWLGAGAPVLEAVLLLGVGGGGWGEREGEGVRIGEEEGKGIRDGDGDTDGEGRCTRILPDFPLWTLATTLDLTYCICSTSWLFYSLFAIFCWGCIPIVCLFQFPVAGKVLRKQLRRILLLKTFGLQFMDDRIGVFDIPGLEIDTEVDGLMVVRGVTVRLSEMSVRVHGVEVGLKLVMGEGEGKEGEGERKEIEVGIVCEEVLVRLGRGIEVGDCFACIKGGEGELSFKDAEEEVGSGKGNVDGEKKVDEVWEVNSKMLRAVKGNEYEYEYEYKFGNANNPNGHDKLKEDRKESPTVQEEITHGHAPKDTNIKQGIETIQTITPDNTSAANKQYQQTLQHIQSTNSIQICRQEVQRLIQNGHGKKAPGTDTREAVNKYIDNDMRAAICSQLHRQPSITHPPSRSIKVTTLQKLLPSHVRAFLHRLPMLLRLLLLPIAYLHPVKISSLTATGSGKWIQEVLSAKLFKNNIHTPPVSPVSSTSTSTSTSPPPPPPKTKTKTQLPKSNTASTPGSCPPISCSS